MYVLGWLTNRQETPLATNKSHSLNTPTPHNNNHNLRVMDFHYCSHTLFSLKHAWYFGLHVPHVTFSLQVFPWLLLKSRFGIRSTWLCGSSVTGFSAETLETQLFWPLEGNTGDVLSQGRGKQSKRYRQIASW